MKSVSGKEFSHIPKAMLEQMANLKLNKEQAQQKNNDSRTPTPTTGQRKADQQYQNSNPLKRKTIPEIVTPQSQQ